VDANYDDSSDGVSWDELGRALSGRAGDLEICLLSYTSVHGFVGVE